MVPMKKLPATYDAASGTITFATDKFSAYALVFEAGTSSGTTTPGSGNSAQPTADRGNGNGTAGSGTAGSNTTGNTTAGNTSQTATVKTGDMTPVGIWFLLALCSGIGAICFRCRKRIKN